MDDPGSNVIPLPIPRLTFEAMDIDEAAALAKYDVGKLYVSTAFQMLNMSPQQMRERVAALTLHQSPEFVGDLISDFEECVADFDALAAMFKCLSARLTAVHRRLI